MFIELTADGQGLHLTRPPFRDEGLTACLLGNKGAGKSNTLAVMAEGFHAAPLPFIYYDPKGDALSLATLGPDVLTIGYPDRPGRLRQAQYDLLTARREAGEFIRLVLEEGRSLAVDLSRQTIQQEDDYADPLNVFMALMEAHFIQANRLRNPVGVFIDEGTVFAPQSGGNKVELACRKLLRLVASDGRSRGMALVVATQHASYLDKALIRGCNLKMFGKITWPTDFKYLENDLPAGWNHPKYGFGKMKRLRSGQTIVVADGLLGQIQIKRRTTPDLGKTPAFKPRPAAQRPAGQLALPTLEDHLANR